MRNSISDKGKRGFSSVVGSVFMVLIISVLASCYFVYTLSQNTAYNAAVDQKNQLDQSVRSENLQCLNTTYTAFNDTNVNIDFGIRNIGSTSVQFITIWISVSNPYSDWTGYNFKNLTKTVQPGSVYADKINLTVAGLNSSYFYSYASWLVTSKGNTVALQTRSMANNIIVSQTTQGIGALMMDFQNFTYYNVSKTAPFVLILPGASGYYVQGSKGPPIGQFAFKVIITDLDIYQRDIVLASSSVLFSIFPSSGGVFQGNSWYIVNVNGTGAISNSYTPVTLHYNEAISLYFASSVPGKYEPFKSAVFTGTTPVNLALVGSIDGIPFGQNIPFVSIYIAP